LIISLPKTKQRKKELEKEMDDLMEVLNVKIVESENLKKAKETLEKDYTEISSILEEKISAGTSGDTSYFQKQILKLSEQLTQGSIEQLALKDQLAKVSGEKSQLNAELARLKEESGPTKIKNERERAIRQKEAMILTKLIKEIKPSDKLEKNYNTELYAAILIQSRLRGKRDRALFQKYKLRHKIVQEIYTSEQSYVIFFYGQ